jgi:phosphoglycolate phosphatase-like HAD superfamily hydrolase
MKIFVDLDGTLIDPTDRIYGVFKDLVPKCELSKNDYWKLKKNGMSNYSILQKKYNYLNHQIQNFHSKWMLKIEEINWLMKDKLFDGVVDSLNFLSNSSKLYLLTNRQSPSLVHLQLKNFGIDFYFKEILVAENLSKSKVLKKLTLGKDDWIIGDTVDDINIGKNFNILTASVSSGVTSKDDLIKSNPDLILNYFSDFKDNYW